MMKRMLLSSNIESYDISSLRCIIYGGAPIYLQDLKAAIRRFGNILVQIYGQAESPMTISFLSREEHLRGADQTQSTRLLSAGVPQTTVEVRIVDHEDKELPTGEVGEIIVRGDVVMKGYWKNPDATEETLRHGWLHTGDLGYKGGEGFIFIVDRKHDMIISGGSNIYSREVEDVITRHPEVLEVVVIGVPDNIWGEAVKAIVVRKPGSRITEQEIIDFCKTGIASYKKPKSVDFVNELPKSPYGKILRREIREKYWAGMERRVH
jgi:long-chain acyl-CoA synthetase